MQVEGFSAWVKYSVNHRNVRGMVPPAAFAVSVIRCPAHTLDVAGEPLAVTLQYHPRYGIVFADCEGRMCNRAA